MITYFQKAFYFLKSIFSISSASCQIDLSLLLNFDCYQKLYFDFSMVKNLLLLKDNYFYILLLLIGVPESINAFLAAS